MAKAPKPKESDIHKGVKKLLDVSLVDGAIHWHVVNEAPFRWMVKSSAWAWWAQKKAMGLLPGIPDHHIFYGGKLYLIELKRPGEKPKDHQSEIMDQFQAQGARVAVAYSVEDVQRLITQWHLHKRVPVIGGVT